MLLNTDNLVFAARRIDMAVPAWQMPQGGITGRETPRAAAMRELKEEIGTKHADIVAESCGWLKYDFPVKLAAMTWGGRYHGQTQKWFAMRFRGEDQDIDLNTTEHAEFSDWRWMGPAEVLGAIVDFKKPLYEAVFSEFEMILRG